MADNVYLGAIEQLQTFAPEPMNLPYSPTAEKGLLLPDQPIVKLPTAEPMTFFKTAAQPTQAPLELQQTTPAETPKEEPKTSGNKNILLYAVGALVIGYLLLKKK